MRRLEKPEDDVFLVTRTSLRENEKPCDQAEQVEVMGVDRRSCADPAEVPLYRGQRDWWFEKGTNHRVENGMIARDMGWHKVWAIDGMTVQEIVDRYGCCIIERDFNGFLTVRIYDDYWE